MRSKHLTSVFAVFLLLSMHLLHAQKPVVIDDANDQYIFTFDNLIYLEDAEGKFTFTEIQQKKLQREFKSNTLYAPHNPNLQSVYWVSIRIQGNASSRKKWMLEIFDQTIDDITAYVPLPNGKYHALPMGDALPFEQRRFMHKNFEIELEHGDTVARDYYFRIQSKSRVNFIVVLRSYDRFIYYALNEYFIYGLFYGMILVVAIYNLLMFFAIRERSYIVYILYVLSVGIFTMTSDGIAFQYLWPGQPAWNELAHAISLFSLVLSALVFTKMFLHTRARHPKLNMMLNAVIIVRALIFILALTMYPALFEYRWIEFVPVTAAFYCGLYSYIKGNKAARFFALAYGLLFVAFCVKVLINIDIEFIAGSIVTHYSISIGFWFEMWLLSFALADKVRIIKDSKDRALRRIIKQHEVNQLLKDKVNRELEHEVGKRTREISDQKVIIEEQNRELHLANEKLREQADEITKMNSLLDLDNYKLKRTIHDEMLARAGSKNMDYDKFKKIFPEELTCLRYLEQQKWDGGFACKKCQHDKFHLAKNGFDRRCSRCGYVESPTAYTIFRGVKFPLEKAFYILHLVITERNDLTIDEISETLNLRRNTCWAFKDKVNKIIKKHHLDKGQAAHWENIIFKADDHLV